MAESKWDGTSTAPSSGDGSAESPYIIDSAAKLAGVALWVNSGQHIDKCYQLTVDIDLNYKTWIPIGTMNQGSLRPFKGSFDGGEHVIRNLSTKIPSDSSKRGVFGYIKGAKISNLGLLNAEITGKDSIGLLVGHADSSEIEKTFSFGRSTGTMYVGGLVGLATGTIIHNSFSVATASGNDNFTGGLAGANGASTGIAGTVSGCYASGLVSRRGTYKGGLLGVNQSLCQVSNVYATGSTQKFYGSAHAAGLIGNHATDASLKNAGFDPQANGQNRFITIGNGKTENLFALSTDLFTNGKLPAPLSPDCFVASIDSYPELRHFQAHSNPAFRNASALSAVPIFFTEKSTSLACDGVLEVPIRDSQKNELHWNLPAGAGVFIASGKPNRAILLLANGEKTFEVSNDIKGGSKPFFVSADVEKGMEIALSPGSHDKTSRATVKYNDTSIDQAIVRFVASGDNTEYIASTDIPADEEGVAIYEIPAGTPAGSYDVHATIPGTAWKSNHIKRDVAPLPDPPAPDDLDPPTPDDPASPDITPPDDPDNPEPAPNPAPPQPESDDITSDDEAPASSPGNCSTGFGGFLPFWGMTLVVRLIKLRR